MTVLESWVGEYSWKRVRECGWRERSKRGPKEEPREKVVKGVREGLSSRIKLL